MNPARLTAAHTLNTHALQLSGSTGAGPACDLCRDKSLDHLSGHSFWFSFTHLTCQGPTLSAVLGWPGAELGSLPM